jgi:hypothetical protein
VNGANRFTNPRFKKIDVSDEVFEALRWRATGFYRTPDDVLAALLNVPTASPEAAEPLAAYVISAEFRGKFTDADKYLAILS